MRPPRALKKGLLLLVAPLTIAHAAALADGMNLAWQTCRTAANNTSAATNNFTPEMPCDDGSAPWTTRRIVMSFKNTTPMTGFGGTTIVLRIDVFGTPFPDFWNFGPGGCSEGMVTGATTLVNGGNCTNPYTLAPLDPAGEYDLSYVSVDAANSRIEYQADHVRYSVGVDLPVPTSPGGYTANNLALPYGYADGSLGGPCAGCCVGAGFRLDRIVYFSLTEARVITTQELRTFITWAGGAWNSCPPTTPTLSATWGQVKALYR